MAAATYLPEAIEPLVTSISSLKGRSGTRKNGGISSLIKLRRNQLLRLVPGQLAELVRTTIGGNGTTIDLAEPVAARAASCATL
jgi:hypothetical protein